jgi:hypothetical protein
MKEKRIQTVVRFPEGLYAELKRKAKSAGMSFNEYVVNLSRAEGDICRPTTHKKPPPSEKWGSLDEQIERELLGP